MANHDESTNYLAYPTLMPLPVQQDRETDRKTDQIQRLLAEKQRIEAELQRLLTAQQKENAGVASSHDQRKPAPAQKNSTSSANSRPASRAPRPEKKQNVLGNVGNSESEISLDGVTAKKDITEIRFLNTLAGAPKGAADLSEAQDGSVRCWTENGVQYIAGEGGVTGGKSCAGLFAGYCKVTAIWFDGNFDTSNVTNMHFMFSLCESLAILDVSDWDTSHTEDMMCMFQACKSLKSLDLSGWDTSNVTDMVMMFRLCSTLKFLDLSGWDTSRVTDMDWMFQDCVSLTSLNLSGWNTSHVTEMTHMFDGCKSLTDFNPKWLDTSHAAATLMYKGTRWE